MAVTYCGSGVLEGYIAESASRREPRSQADASREYVNKIVRACLSWLLVSSFPSLLRKYIYVVC